MIIFFCSDLEQIKGLDAGATIVIVAFLALIGFLVYTLIKNCK